MRFWIDATTSELYGAQFRRSVNDYLAPPRPTGEHQWVNGAWTLPPDLPDQRARRGVEEMAPRFLFELLFVAENDKRELRRTINQILPNTFTAAESTAITRLQYRNALINLWRQLNEE